jgi:hypothetical protein
MVASLLGSVGTGTKEDESSTGRVWAAGFHHVTDPFSLGARFENYKPFIFLIFPIFFRAAVNRGYGSPPVFSLVYLLFGPRCFMNALSIQVNKA